MVDEFGAVVKRSYPSKWEIRQAINTMLLDLNKHEQFDTNNVTEIIVKADKKKGKYYALVRDKNNGEYKILKVTGYSCKEVAIRLRTDGIFVSRVYDYKGLLNVKRNGLDSYLRSGSFNAEGFKVIENYKMD